LQESSACRLTEEEDAKESRWERKNTFHSESFEEIFVEFGSTSFFFFFFYNLGCPDQFTRTTINLRIH
jgi:hypothetical protein